VSKTWIKHLGRTLSQKIKHLVPLINYKWAEVWHPEAGLK